MHDLLPEHYIIIIDYPVFWIWEWNWNPLQSNIQQTLIYTGFIYRDDSEVFSYQTVLVWSWDITLAFSTNSRVEQGRGTRASRERVHFSPKKENHQLKSARQNVCRRFNDATFQLVTLKGVSLSKSPLAELGGSISLLLLATYRFSGVPQA